MVKTERLSTTLNELANLRNQNDQILQEALKLLEENTNGQDFKFYYKDFRFEGQYAAVKCLIDFVQKKSGQVSGWRDQYSTTVKLGRGGGTHHLARDEQHDPVDGLNSAESVADAVLQRFIQMVNEKIKPL